MKSYSLFVFIIAFAFISCKTSSKVGKSEIQKPIVIKAFDFEQKPNTNPFYKDKKRQVLGINAVRYKNKFASAITTFQGKKGWYQINLTTMTEIDGESTYKIFVNDKLIAEFQNPETEKDFQEHLCTIKKVRLKSGDIIEIQFNSHSNGKIPEGDAFAFSRGRWKQIELLLAIIK